MSDKGVTFYGALISPKDQTILDVSKRIYIFSYQPTVKNGYSIIDLKAHSPETISKL